MVPRQVLTGDQWGNVLADAMDSEDGTWTAPVFFAAFFMFSVYIILNLFIAVGERPSTRPRARVYTRGRVPSRP